MDMTESPIFWIAAALTLGMGVRGFLQGFTHSLFRLQLLVLALVVTGALLGPAITITRQWFDWPMYFHQLVFGGLMFGLFYSAACSLLTRLLRPKPLPSAEGDDVAAPVPERIGFGSRFMGMVVGLLAGAVMGAIVAFLAGVKPDFDQLHERSMLLDDATSLSDYGYELDAFDTPTELPVSQLINAIVLSPVKGVKLLQEISVQPEFIELLASAYTQELLREGDIFALTEDPTFDQLIATAPVKDLWALQRELEGLTDVQLEQETAAQLVDAYRRIDKVRHHPRVAEVLAEGEFRTYLQTADLAVLIKDARVLELGDAIIGVR